MAVAIIGYIKHLESLKTKNNFVIIESIRSILDKKHHLTIMNAGTCVEFSYYADQTKEKIGKVINELKRLDFDYKILFYFVSEKLAEPILKHETKEIDAIDEITDCNYLGIEFSPKKNSITFLRFELMVIAAEKIFNAEEKIGNKTLAAHIMDSITRRNKKILVFHNAFLYYESVLNKYGFKYHRDSHCIYIDGIL